MLVEIVNERVSYIAPDDLAFGIYLTNGQVFGILFGNAAAEHSFDGKSIVAVSEGNDAAFSKNFQHVINVTLHEPCKTFRHEDNFRPTAFNFADKN